MRRKRGKREEEERMEREEDCYDMAGSGDTARLYGSVRLCDI
jgi:hypothetical protein